MGQIDRPVIRGSLFPSERPIEEPSSIHKSEATDLGDDGPLASARGVVNGVMFGIILWVVILWAIL
jgi:hypothetical protein